MRILFTGGGTGGHIIPILAVARELQSIYSGNDLKLSYLGPNDPFARNLLPQEGISVSSVPAGKFRRNWKDWDAFLWNIFDLGFKMPIGIFLAFWKLFFSAPDLIFSKGGYGAVPITIAAWLLGTPVILHESDFIPGRANAYASKFAREIFTSYPRTIGFPEGKVLHTGNPVRTNLLGGSTERAQEIFGLEGGKPIILIIGGSQGATRVNDMILATFPGLLERFEVIHQTGERNYDQVVQESRVVASDEQLARYHPVKFMREVDLKHAYKVANLIVSRAGSGSIFEIAALKKPSILIPLPEAAQDHQVKNAYEYASTGAAIIMEDQNLTPHFFLEKLNYLFTYPEEMDRMVGAAHNFSNPRAAHVIAMYLIEYFSSRS